MMDIAQDAIVGEESRSIDARLQQRLAAKSSSAKLMQEADPQGMFRDQPADCTKDQTAEYHVAQSQEFLEQFQDIFKRIRQTGRQPSQERDVSDSILKAMHYKAKRRSGDGGGGKPT